MKRNNCFISSIDPKGFIAARTNGLGLEIAHYCTAWNMDRELEATDADVKKQLSGISRSILHAPFNELFPCAIDPKARELASYRYSQAISLAQTYHSNKVIIHGGYQPRMYYSVWYLEQSILFWKSFAEKIPENMTVCLENVFEEDPAMLLEIIENVNSPKIKLCLDIGHVNAYSNVPVIKWVEVCGTQISHVHLHNNHGFEDTHNALDDGTIVMPDFLDNADAICPSATYTLEVMDSEKSVRWLEKQNLLR